LLLRVSTPLPQSLMSLKARAASCSLSDEELQLSFRAFAKCCEERNDVSCRSGSRAPYKDKILRDRQVVRVWRLRINVVLTKCTRIITRCQASHSSPARLSVTTVANGMSDSLPSRLQ
jgi:hypothetical protein